MFDFEIRERDDENEGSKNYQSIYHGYPIMEYWDSEFFELVKALYKPGDRILDLGCGPGSLWPYWNKLSEVGQLVGVDLSDGMISEAQKAYPDGEFKVGRAHEIPYPSGSFDIVIASSVLHHIPDSHLDGALGEIVRVMDEHGVLVGREPINAEGQFGTKPGWLSGALMNFRHLVYRLTNSRESVEPELGDHHHTYDSKIFLDELAKNLHLDAYFKRFPVSNYVARVKDARIAGILKKLDELLKGEAGSMFYYSASKNFAEAKDVSNCVDRELEQQGSNPDKDKEFLAYLKVAAIEIEKHLSKENRRG